MSNFICSECGMTNIDCGYAGYKTPKEIELEKENKRLQEQLDIVIEQRNDIHIDKQILQKQLNEANRIIKKLYKESGNPIGIDYLEKWGVR